MGGKLMFMAVDRGGLLDDLQRAGHPARMERS